MTATMVFFIAAYILDISMRSTYSNANLLRQIHFGSAVVGWRDTLCTFIEHCSPHTAATHVIDPDKTLTF